MKELPGTAVAPSRLGSAERAVTVLRRSDCSHGAAAIVAIGELAAALGLHVRIEEIRVDTDETARAQKCPGSPTVRVDGLDVEPAARSRTSFGAT